LKATEFLSDQVGEIGAKQFYSAGVSQGEAMVQGVMDAIRAAGFSLDASGNIVAPTSATAPASTSPKPTPKPKPLTGSFVPPSYVRKAPETSSTGRGEYTAFANGGIVTKPMLGLVGEAGPEAIIPLNKLGKSGAVYNITVNAGIGTDGAQVGREIVDAIRRFERASGPVFASA
jgi:hypothetical protein